MSRSAISSPSASAIQAGVTTTEAAERVDGPWKTYTVKVNNEKLDLPQGTVVKVGLSKAAGSAVELVGSPTDLEPDPLDGRLLKGAFTLEGIAESRRVQVSCHLDDLEPVFVELQIIPAGPVDREIPDNFAFHRKTYTVRHGGRRTLVLRTRSDGAAQPKLRLEDAAVAVVREQGRFELVAGTTYHEAIFTVEGRKPNGKTKVIAEADGRSARCELRVVEGRTQASISASDLSITTWVPTTALCGIGRNRTSF
jgi:hypothetical protein